MLIRDVTSGVAEGDKSADWRVLTEVELDTRKLKGGTFPRTWESTFKLPKNIPRWEWVDADRVNAEDMSEGVSLVREVHHAVDTRNLAKLFELLSIPIRERTVCHGGSSVQTTEGELAKTYEEIFAIDGFRLDKFEPNKLELIPHCGGRIIEVLDEEMRAPIKQVCDLQGWVLPLHIGRKNGRWVVLSL